MPRSTLIAHAPPATIARVALLSAAISCAAPAASPTRPGPAAQLPPPIAAGASAHAAKAAKQRRVIVFVWDGLRPDSVDAEHTPELARLRDQRGVNFRGHHSVYPTFTMMNAAALATGTRSGRHGFYGNYEYQPGPKGTNAKGTAVDYAQPVFSEDHAILQTLDAFYRERGSALLAVPTLFEVAHAAGFQTAAIGKAGAAFIQDYRQAGASGVILDENVVLPHAFGRALQAAGLPLPKNTVNHRYPEGALELAADNGDPTAATEPTLVMLADGKTPDPRASSGSPHKQRNAYLMRAFLEYVLPEVDPVLSVIWLRNPDSTQHSYGPGTPNVLDALAHQDQLLTALLAALERLGRAADTDVIVVSDHGHSTVASDPKVFPPRALQGEPDGKATLGAPREPGYAVSGEVRSAEWLRRAGLPNVYDGVGCVYGPVLGGVNARGQALHPSHSDESCGNSGLISTRGYKVPEQLPADAIIIAANGGSEYFYVPSHDPELVARLVTALQERRPYSALFVHSHYGELPGCLPLTRIGMEPQRPIAPPTPDLVASFEWDDAAVTAAAPHAPGSEHSSPQGYRGMHGSFSPVDVHNTLIAVGPGFRSGFVDDYPSSNLDVAPTIAKLLGLSLPDVEGRVLDEALVGAAVQYRVEAFEDKLPPVPLRRVCGLDDPDCKRPVRGAAYRVSLHGQRLTSADGTREHVYLDRAVVKRSPLQPNEAAQVRAARTASLP